MAYDPRACGAKCDVCPLQGRKPVPPESRLSPMELLAGKGIALINSVPTGAEEKAGTMFTAGVGAELNRALKGAGIHRDEVHATFAVLCSVPEGSFKEFEAKRRAANETHKAEHRKQKLEAKKKGLPEPPAPALIPSPLECCAPRLQQEVYPFTDFIAFGSLAYQSIRNTTVSASTIRGALIELEATETALKRRIVATIHPSMLLKQPRWSHVFRGDVQRAAQWFRGQVSWKPPRITYQPTAAELERFFEDASRPYTFDIETDGIESLTTRIRCIAIGTADDVMVMSFLPKDGVAFTSHGDDLRTYSQLEEIIVKAVLFRVLEDPNYTKVGHNAGYFDKITIQSQWGITPKPIVDTLLLHRCVESEMPHSLAYVGSVYTVVEDWKTDRETGNKLAYGAETDKELATYCATDVAITARVLEPLIDKVVLRQQQEVWRLDQRIQAVCADMHTAGMYVDQKKRLEEETRLLARRHQLLQQIQERTGKPQFNPGSIYQMRDLLFEEWRLVPQLEEEERLTSSGDPSTADLVLRALLTDPTLPPEQRDIIKLIRYYRKIMKVLGTYVVKMRPSNIVIESDLGWDEEEDWADKDTRSRYGIEKRGIVNPRTGRMYPGYNAGVTTTGRLSSSKPMNAQNYPKNLRAIVTAQQGHVLVGADMDQLELRIAAARWNVGLYLRAFADGKDPHSMTAFAVFGDAFCQAAGITADQFSRPGALVGASYVNGKFEGSGEAKKMRDLSKAVQYASQYMAVVETVHKLICKTEIASKADDGTTELPYALLQLKRVRQMRDNWMKNAPEFAKGWEREIETYRQQGYLKEDVTGRRRDFLDGEMPNEIVNFPIQSSAAGLMNLALLEIHDKIPLHKWGPGTGVINQCHDSIVVECPEDEAESVAKILEDAMNQTHASLPGVTFTATAAIGKTWKEVG
jgi:DNA polymerase I-like protein with 3'-5' exonuclease and polymerase domains/uracil-DNA glycosylase